MSGSRDEFISGDWNVLCDICHFKFKASELRKRWDGYYVCEDDWEERHPQDRIKSVPDKQNVPWTRPEPTSDTFIDPENGGCTIEERQAVAGQGVAGCMVAGLDSVLASEEPIPSGTFDGSL